MPLLLALAVERPARADTEPEIRGLDLTWIAPDGCPEVSTVLSQIRRVVGNEPPPLGQPRLSAEATVVHGADGRWRVRIVTLGEAGGERVLDSSSCSALAGATALVLAIRLKPSLVLPGAGPTSGADGASTTTESPPPPPEPPPAPAMPTPMSENPAPLTERTAREWRVEPSLQPAPRPIDGPKKASVWTSGALLARASVVGTLGELPTADGSAELEVTYVLRHVRLAVHGETGLVETIPAVTTTPGATASFRAAGGGVRGCYGPTFRRLDVYGCADAELDALWGTGHGFATSLPPVAGTWMTVGAVAAGRYRLTDRLGLGLFTEALAPIERPSFVTESAAGTQTALDHRPSVVWGRIGIGVDARFF
jgi:hypothetical protein